MAGHLPARRADWPAARPSPQERVLLEQFIDAHERGDVEAAAAIAARDIRVTMPPYPMCFDGIDALRPLLVRAFGPDRDGDWRLVPTCANRMPAAASYLRRPGDREFRAFKLDVLRTEAGPRPGRSPRSPPSATRGSRSSACRRSCELRSQPGHSSGLLAGDARHALAGRHLAG